ncbi:hypothetical protein [Rugosimonospora africana]|uniref:hypothetical protein n=1 Tax=Rugosimonospora africana TaxID=556532 RepID=UPI001944B466|nr:hypothetical protein [Rugosimonospora africana]
MAGAPGAAGDSVAGAGASGESVAGAGAAGDRGGGGFAGTGLLGTLRPAAPGADREPPDLRRRLWFALVTIGAAWIFALVAHLAHLDAVTLLVVVVATAVTLRSPGSPLDRLVVAVALLAGTTCGAALLLSVWPWHLRPQVLGGCALTGLALIIAVRGELPAVRIRPRAGDLAVLAPAGVLALPFLASTFHASLPVRLGSVLRGEDLARHFAMFDTIRRVGGYVFLHRTEASDSIASSDLAYPQGAHLLAAVLDNFLTSSATVGRPVPSVSHFLYYDQLNYLFLAFAVLWAAHRLAGPGVRPLAFVPIGGLCVAYLLFGSPITTYTYGFFPEITGLGFLALLTGVLVRPLRSVREQVVVVTALVVAVSYCYYLLLPVVVVGVLGHVLVYRRRLLPAWPFAVAVAVVGVAVSAVPRLEAHGEQALSLQLLLQDFGVVRVQRGPLLALCILVGVGVAVTGSWWRSPAIRVMAVTGAGAVLFAAGVGGYEGVQVGRTLYFFEKSLHTVIVLLLIASGAAAGLAQRVLDGVAVRYRAAPLACAVALGLVPVAGLGGLDWDPQQLAGAEFHDPAYGTSPGRLLVGGAISETVPARTALIVAERFPDPGDKITLVATGRQTDNLSTFYTWMMQRNYGRAWRLYPSTFTARTAYQYQVLVLTHQDQHFRVVTDNPVIATSLASLAILRPDLRLEVDDLRQLHNW